MNRRKFFAFLPIAPLALVAEGARAVTADGAPIPEACQIVLQGNKKAKPVHYHSEVDGSISFTMPATSDPTKAVSMAVGDDGNLWLKRRDGDWRRVAVE